MEQFFSILAETGEPAHRLIQGLDHIEYELAVDHLRDKDGQPVADPCSWSGGRQQGAAGHGSLFVLRYW